MDKAASANGEAAPHGAANEGRDAEDAMANQQRDEELGAANGSSPLKGSANEGKRSCGSANEDTEPQELTNDSKEPEPTNEDRAHRAPTNENRAHKAPTNENAGHKSSQSLTNQDSAPRAAANQDSSLQPPANQAPPNQATPPHDPTNDLAAPPEAANGAPDPWDWSLEEAWLRAPVEEGFEEWWAGPEGWGAEPGEDEEDEEGLDQWQPSSDRSEACPDQWRLSSNEGQSEACLVKNEADQWRPSSDRSDSSDQWRPSSNGSESCPDQWWPSSDRSESCPDQWQPSPDGSWSKLILRPGRGLARPGPGSLCRVLLAVPPSGPAPCPTSGAGHWLSLRLGTAEGRWACAVDAVLETMTAGERSRLRPNAATARTLTVLLGRFTPAPPFWETPPAARWRSVTSAQTRAVTLLARGFVAPAARAFSRALRTAAAAAGLAPCPPDAAELKAELHAGLASAQLRLGLPAAAAANAGKALGLCPAHVEARYRRGLALAAMMDLEEAVADLAAVLREEPSHAGARRELRRVRGAVRERDARLARRLGRLFA